MRLPSDQGLSSGVARFKGRNRSESVATTNRKRPETSFTRNLNHPLLPVALALLIGLARGFANTYEPPRKPRRRRRKPANEKISVAPVAASAKAFSYATLKYDVNVPPAPQREPKRIAVPHTEHAPGVGLAPPLRTFRPTFDAADPFGDAQRKRELDEQLREEIEQNRAKRQAQKERTARTRAAKHGGGAL